MPGLVIEAGGSLIDYSDPNFNDGVQYNAGLFYNAQLTDYIKLDSRLGYTVYSPQGSGQFGVQSVQEGGYAQIAIDHRLNKSLRHVLSGGRQVDTGLQWGSGGRLLNYYFLRWNVDWNVIRNITLTTGFRFEDGKQTGTVNEKFNLFGVELFLQRPITQKLTASLGYRFTLRESNSDLPNYTYTANSVYLSGTYRF